MNRRRAELRLAAVALGVSSALAASTYFPISDDALRSRSDAVVVVRTVSARVVPTDGPYTETQTRCVVEEVARGAPPREIDVAIPGGRLPEGRGSYFWMPELAIGHRYALFLKRRADGLFTPAEGPIGVFELDETGTTARRPERVPSSSPYAGTAPHPGAACS